MFAMSKVAMEFDSKKELKRYLKEHPGADPAKHRVRLSPKKPGKADDAAKHLDYIAHNFEIPRAKLQKVLKMDTADLRKKSEGLDHKNDQTLKKLEGDPTIHARAKKELMVAGDRTNKSMNKLEASLSQATGDPKKARAIRDYVEALANESYLEDEIKVVKARGNNPKERGNNAKTANVFHRRFALFISAVEHATKEIFP